MRSRSRSVSGTHSPHALATAESISERYVARSSPATRGAQLKSAQQLLGSPPCGTCTRMLQHADNAVNCTQPWQQWIAPGPPTVCGWQTQEAAAARLAPLAPAHRRPAPAPAPARCRALGPSPARRAAARGCPSAAPGCRCLPLSRGQGEGRHGHQAGGRRAWADRGCAAALHGWLLPPPLPQLCPGTPAGGQAGGLAPEGRKLFGRCCGSSPLIRPCNLPIQAAAAGAHPSYATARLGTNTACPVSSSIQTCPFSVSTQPCPTPQVCTPPSADVQEVVWRPPGSSAAPPLHLPPTPRPPSTHGWRAAAQR